MKRRDFIRQSVSAGIITGAGLSLMNSKLLAGPYAIIAYDLVAIKNSEPDIMFDKAISVMGGLQAFIKPGQKVVVKPNIGWDSTPERAANTNPKLVGRIVKRALDAGAKEVLVFDYTCDDWQKCYRNSMIEKYVKDNGGKMIPANTENYYQQVSVPKGKKLTSVKEHEAILESDVFINVPVLKHHGGAQMSSAMKNMMGIVWDRMYWHRNDLHQCIADFSSYRKPTLNVVDAYNVIKRNGPRGVSVDDVSTMKSLLISTDIVTADAAAAKLFGKSPEEIGYINNAASMDVGSKDLASRSIKRIVL